jgi:nucleoprotein TPR
LTKITELNIMRESNATLRIENKKALKTIEQLEKQLTTMRLEMDPFREQLADMQARQQVSDQERQMIQEDRDRWHERYTKFLSTQNKIDPDEYNKLKLQVEQLQAEAAMHLQENERLHATIKLNEKKSAKYFEAGTHWRSVAQARQLDLDALRSQSGDKGKMLEQENAGLQAEKTALEAQRDTLQKDIDKAKQDIEKEKKVAEAWKEKFNQVRELAKKYREEAAKGPSATANEQLETKMSQLVEQHKQEMQALRDNATNEMNDYVQEAEQKIRQLEERLGQLGHDEPQDEGDEASGHKRARTEMAEDLLHGEEAMPKRVRTISEQLVEQEEETELLATAEDEAWEEEEPVVEQEEEEGEEEGEAVPPEEDEEQQEEVQQEEDGATEDDLLTQTETYDVVTETADGEIQSIEQQPVAFEDE